MKALSFLLHTLQAQPRKPTEQKGIGSRLAHAQMPLPTITYKPNLDVLTLFESKINPSPLHDSALPLHEILHFGITKIAMEASTTAKKSQILPVIFNLPDSIEEEKNQRSEECDGTLSVTFNLPDSFEEQRKQWREQFDDAFNQLIEKNSFRLEALPCLIEKKKTIIQKASKYVRRVLDKNCISEERYDIALRTRWDNLLLYIHVMSTHGDIVSKTEVSNITRTCMNSMLDESSRKIIDDQSLNSISQEIFDNIPFKDPTELFMQAQHHYFSRDMKEVCEEPVSNSWHQLIAILLQMIISGTWLEPHDNDQLPTGHITKFYEEFTHSIYNTMRYQAKCLIEHQLRLNDLSPRYSHCP